ncbi:hypothetical protein [Planomonospora sp. ID82291]|uniref:hypothetical protein n=1 Tax=Planomonospora sp. ID82291 TaxID=2738136 RepID=UPI0018C4226A|nr:hypothetical protein [Planomonospora sp. ID82291]MBG0818376.1 hypothetical protein [Planomonospora sp. ID82291]
MDESRPADRPLMRVRQAANLTQEEAAEQLSALSWKMLQKHEITQPATVSPRQYRRWESPDPPWPHTDHRRVLERFFGRSVHDLGFRPKQGLSSARRATCDETQDEPVNSMGVPDRRQVIAGAAALGMGAVGALPWMAPAFASSHDKHGPRVGSEEVALLQATALDLDIIDQRFGGDRLWRSARVQLLLVQHLIEQGTYSDSIGHQLHGIAGQLTTSIGWFCYDAGQQTEARAHFSEALNTAMLNGDDVLAARTLANMARQAVDLGRPREAVRFAQLARGHASQWDAPPRVWALLAIREAHGHAVAGDVRAFEAALSQAWAAFDHGVTDRDPEWTAFLNEAELRCLEGICRADLGQHGRSVVLLERAAELQPVEYSRNRGMSLARLAGAALDGGDLDRCVAATRESLALAEDGISSTRIHQRLRLVRQGLAAHQTSPPVREITDQLARYSA